MDFNQILLWAKDNWVILVIGYLLLTGNGGSIGGILETIKNSLTPKPTTPPATTTTPEPTTPTTPVVDKIDKVVDLIMKLIPLITTFIPKPADAKMAGELDYHVAQLQAAAADLRNN